MVSDKKPMMRQWRGWHLVILLCAALLLLIGLLIGTEPGAQLIFSRLVQGPGLRIDGVQGRLLGPLRIDHLRLDSGNQIIDLTDLQVDWQPRALLQGRLHVWSVRLTKLQVTRKIEQHPEPAKLPDRIALPFDLQVDRVQIDSGEIRKGPVSLVQLGQFGFRLDFDGTRYSIQLDQLAARTGGDGAAFSGNFTGQATLSARRPYAL